MNANDVQKSEIRDAMGEIVNMVGILEFYRIFLPAGRPVWLVGVIVAEVLFITSFLVANLYVGPAILLINIPVIIIPFIIQLFFKDQDALSGVSVLLTGFFYIALPMSLLNFFYNPSLLPGTSHKEILVVFLAVLWIYDSAAYLSGSSLGRHKFWERISPKKTWEGVLGGLIFGLAATWVFSKFYTTFAPFEWMAFGLIIMVFGTLGDLVESMFKRSRDIKDSGTLLPGHGGVLDRFDSILGAVPFVYIYLLLIL